MEAAGELLSGPRCTALRSPPGPAPTPESEPRFHLLPQPLPAAAAELERLAIMRSSISTVPLAACCTIQAHSPPTRGRERPAASQRCRSPSRPLVPCLSSALSLWGGASARCSRAHRDIWIKLGIALRRSNSVCSFTAALVERKWPDQPGKHTHRVAEITDCARSASVIEWWRTSGDIVNRPCASDFRRIISRAALITASCLASGL